MQTTRRDLLTLVGGSALGVLFTPAPWRLISDTALWSENWPGIPRPARGEIQAKFTNCAVCPAGCAVRARCVGGRPVALSGVAGHPLSQGALCPFGIAGHHLPYHPRRLKQGPAAEAAAAVAGGIAKCGPNERVAALDLRPGRTASWTYRRAMAAVKNGLYLTAPQPPAGAAADLSKARTVVSFGVPVLDGWGTPGNVLRARHNFRLIQIEAIESRTATLADSWLRIKPGSEAALAAALARGDSAGAAEASGLSAGEVAQAAGAIASGNALVLANAGCPEAWALNRRSEALVARAEAPVPDAWRKAAPVADFASAPDGSIRVLFIDESAPGDYIPWNAIQKKLVADNPVVVAFAWSLEGYGRHARFTLPAAVFPEMTDDLPNPVDHPAAAFRLATPLTPAPEGMVSAPAFVARAAGFDAANALRERADAIHKAGRGALYASATGQSTPIKDVKADDFWKALNEGACWLDGAQAPKPAAIAQAGPPAAAKAADPAYPLAIAFAETRAATALASPILSKLHQESGVRLGAAIAALHPDSAAAAGLAEGARARLETALGRREVEVVFDSAVPPGIVAVAASPETLDIAGAGERARVVRA